MDLDLEGYCEPITQTVTEKRKDKIKSLKRKLFIQWLISKLKPD
jgi:hypothetical protein